MDSNTFWNEATKHCPQLSKPENLGKRFYGCFSYDFCKDCKIYTEEEKSKAIEQRKRASING